jgi:hypothetical protein
MASQIEKCIGFLEETSDTGSAYFSFTTDDSGEHGIIKANKEGLRLYALELLKKSVEMEKQPDSSDVLFFEDQEWLVDDAGYNLIWGVDPTNETRQQIVSDGFGTSRPVTIVPSNKYLQTVSGWLPSLIILSGGALIVTFAAFKWFH